MTESQKRPHRHPKYKTAYRVNNWREYDQLLRDRGDITLWISHDVLTAWRAPMTGKRGAQPVYSATVTESHEQDPSQVPELLSQVDHVIDRFIGDGIYDQAPVYAAVARHSPGARVIVPPRKDAVLSSQVATSPTQRDGHILAIASNGRFPWKRTSGYYAQSHAENAFSRYKRRVGGRLRAKKDEAQEREASIACGLLNRMREWGRPHSYRVG
jgi:hypothetical protein